jgi:hypothetical protein
MLVFALWISDSGKSDVVQKYQKESPSGPDVLACKTIGKRDVTRCPLE